MELRGPAWLFCALLTSAPLAAQEASIVVEAQRGPAVPAQKSPEAVTVLTRGQIQASGRLALDDLLRDIPGFSTFRRSSSLDTSPAEDPEAQGVSLRGIGPGGASRALVLMDGIPINDAFGGWIYWGELPLDEIERIEIVQGGSSSLWGSFAEGGVINIVTRKSQYHGAEAKLSGGTRGASDDGASVALSLGALKARAGGDYFRADGWNVTARSRRGPIDGLTGAKHGAGRLRLDYAPSKDLGLWARGSYYGEDRNGGTPFRSAAAHRGFAAAGAELRGDGGASLKLSLFTHQSSLRESFSQASAARTSETPTQLQHAPSDDWGASLVWSRSAGAHALSAGADLRQVDGRSEDQFFNSSGTAIADRQVSSGRQQFAGLFARDLWRPSPAWTLALSARADFWRNSRGQVADAPAGSSTTLTAFGPGSRAAFSPRLDARRELSGAWALRGALYGAFRAPTLAELYRRSSVESLVLFQNPGLSPERLEGSELGMDFKPGPAFQARLTGYWDILRRPIGNIVTAADPVTGQDSQRTRVNLGRARIRGVEGDAGWRLNAHWSLQASFLVLEAVLTSNPADPTLEGKRLAQVPWTNAAVGVAYSNPDWADLQVQARYVGLQYEDSDNGDTLSSYVVFDASVTRRLPESLASGELYLTAQNLFNKEYAVDKGGGILKTGTPLLVLAGIRLRLF